MSQHNEDRVIKIVILDRGYVYVGRVVQEGEWVVVYDPKNIRKYGTTRGLGELAIEGPKANTILDECGTVRIPLHAVTHIMEVDQSKWT